MNQKFQHFNTNRWQEGNYSEAYKYLGAHPAEHGVYFSVWAPNATRLSVVGTFNKWGGQKNLMEKDEATGIWSAFVSDANPGDLYKYEIQTESNSDPFLKSDPYGWAMELPPKTASQIYEPKFEWDDSCWLQDRRQNQSLNKPLSIYEVHLGSWKRKDSTNQYLTYRELADRLIPYVQKMGFTHIEVMPVAEHPYDPSWGYQITGYFAPTSRFGEPDGFKYFVNECHKQGIGVIMDWVPGHFPKDEYALHMFDGTPLYEYGDSQKRQQKDWNTHIFDYSKAGVRNFLLSNAHYWCNNFHIDGFRVDAVASMLYLDYSKGPDEWSPNKYGGRENLEAVSFLEDFNEMIHQQFPGVLTLAEESTAWPGVTTAVNKGGLGFDYKWDMGWMNDTLEYIARPPASRKGNTKNITFPMMYNETEDFVLPLSHDEVVHLKKPLVRKGWGNEQQQFANLRLLFTYMYGHPGKKLLFMGGEFAETREWSESRSLYWDLLEEHRHSGIQTMIQDLNKLYCNEPVLYKRLSNENSFKWIDRGVSPPSCFTFLRGKPESVGHLLFILNFSDQEIGNYQPDRLNDHQYLTLFNSESKYYGGTNTGGLCGSPDKQHLWIASFSGLILQSQ
ncbi:1,4-alpha-glucan branching enzyme [Fodinibius salinus]|uniref:1,4-alpha-glucan branching enzyme GlgB n=1 Tax=Fodinibius salinus TaxID=860790 RepID=A0A5D3YLD7_9BACT|nr:1,4-alpha-glucan branching protein GlgB [Fodinibius salinus]TYP93497.1 1,4-alpha-glucan branching enzyme [Fodinibius salinus]